MSSPLSSVWLVRRKEAINKSERGLCLAAAALLRLLVALVCMDDRADDGDVKPIAPVPMADPLLQQIGPPTRPWLLIRTFVWLAMPVAPSLMAWVWRSATWD